MITVDLRSRVPIYEQLIAGIRKAILSGKMAPDEQLPSVRTLALELGINPNTIQKAYNELERQGAIYSLKGRGSFVSGDTAALGEEEFGAVKDELERLLRRAKESGVSSKQMSEVLDGLCGKIWDTND